MAHAIEVAGLTKRFGPVLAVDDLSFTVDEGRVVGFLGPNGAGKTTTLRMLLGLVNPTAGDATVHGQPYVELDDPVHTVGAVLDGGMLHPGRSGPQPPARARAGVGDRRRARRRAAASSSRSTTPANRRAGGYSLGMRQRLGLAAALLGDPKVLVLDEPANGLDPQGIRWLRDFLRRLAGEGRAVLVSSHVLAEVAQTADDVVVIEQGPLASRRRRWRRSWPAAAAGCGSPARTCARSATSSTRRARRSAATARQILVSDRTGEQIGRVVAEHQLVISELAPVGASLEDDLLRAHRRAREARHDPPDRRRDLQAAHARARSTRSSAARSGSCC